MVSARDFIKGAVSLVWNPSNEVKSCHQKICKICKFIKKIRNIYVYILVALLPPQLPLNISSTIILVNISWIRSDGKFPNIVIKQISYLEYLHMNGPFIVLFCFTYKLTRFIFDLLGPHWWKGWTRKCRQQTPHPVVCGTSFITSSRIEVSKGSLINILSYKT